MRESDLFRILIIIALVLGAGYFLGLLPVIHLR